MNAKKVLVLLADGFEETEACAPIDVLRRLEFEVIVAGVSASLVRGAHNLLFKADTLLADVRLASIDAIFLPGGMPGANNLRDSDAVMETLRTLDAKGAIISAICAAPIALAKAGVTNGKNITAYPGHNEQLKGATYTGNRVECDGRVITAKGPGVSFEFAAELAVALGKPRGDVQKLMDAMFVKS